MKRYRYGEEIASTTSQEIQKQTKHTVVRRSVQQFNPRKLHKYESSDNFNSKATGSSVINPDWSFYEEASTLAKWSLVLSATSNVPSTGPNSLVRDNRRSAGQISEHVVCFDSTQTTPVDTT